MIDNSSKELIKNEIEFLINNGEIEKAEILLNQYAKEVKDDIDIISFYAVINIIKDNYDNANEIVDSGLDIDSNNFDLLHNKAFIMEKKGNTKQAIYFYKECLKNCNEELKESIDNHIKDLKKEYSDDFTQESMKKISIIVKQGMDSFLHGIINELEKQYIVRKYIVTSFDMVDDAMLWGDICWFEWCDELIGYASNLQIDKQCKLICRIHSYEVFTDYIKNVSWENVDKIIMISETIKNIFLEAIDIDKNKITIIPNGVDLNKWSYKDNIEDFNIAYVGYINYKKGPMLLLHSFKAIYDYDKRFKLYIAGKFQDYRDKLYFQQMIHELGLEENIIFDGWIDDLDNWLNDKNYIICTSVLESQNMSVMQAMAKGIKPLIHNFVGAKLIYDEKFIWNTMNDLIFSISNNVYNSEEYRSFIEKNYSQVKINNLILNTIENLDIQK